MADTIGKYFKNKDCGPQPYRKASPPQPTPKLRVSTPTMPFQEGPQLSQPSGPVPFQEPPQLSQPGQLPLQSSPVLSVPTAPTAIEAPALRIPDVLPNQAPPKLSVPATLPDQSTANFVAPSTPTEVPFQAPPTLSTPGLVPLSEAPPLTLPSQVPFQEAPALSIPAIMSTQEAPKLSVPAIIVPEAAPALRVPDIIDPEPAPALRVPDVIPFEPAPPLRVPDVIPFEDPPPLRVPDVIGFEPAPDLRVPDVIPFEDAPPLRVPDAIATQLPPDLRTPDTIALQPNPDLRVTGTLPAPPAFGIPNTSASFFQQAPALRQPAVIPEPIVKSEHIDLGPLGQITLPTDYAVSTALKNEAIAATQAASVRANIMASSSLANRLGDAAPYANIQGALAGYNMAKNPAALLDAGLSVLAGLANSPPEFYRPDIKTAAEQNKIPEDDEEARRIEGQIASQNANNVINPYTMDPVPGGNDAGVRNFNYADGSGIQPTSLEKINSTAVQVPDLNLKNVFLERKPDSRGLYGGNNVLPVNSGYTQKATDDPIFRKMQGADAKQDQMSYKFWFDSDDGASYDQPQQTQNQVYLPFSLTDLRFIPGNNGFRTIYLQPFITNLAQGFAPSWNMQQFFGRVDPVATYQSTGRTWNLGFKMVAFHPSDLQIIYKKMNWLQSMVYPEYDANVRYKSGPVSRLRLGNIIDSMGPNGQRGLPGVITQLDFDYSETIWEVEADWQVPRHISVSMGFHVLHELPIGNVAGYFGGIGQVDADGRYFTPKQLLDAGADNEDVVIGDAFNTAGVNRVKG